MNREDIFYYPDVMVAGGDVRLEEHHLRDPRLDEYVLVAQDTREVTLHRREEQWRPAVITTTTAPVEFRSIKLTVPLAQIYEGGL